MELLTLLNSIVCGKVRIMKINIEAKTNGIHQHISMDIVDYDPNYADVIYKMSEVMREFNENAVELA